MSITFTMPIVTRKIDIYTNYAITLPLSLRKKLPLKQHDLITVEIKQINGKDVEELIE